MCLIILKNTFYEKMPASVLACENEQVFLLYFIYRYGKKIYVYLYTNTSRDQNQDSNVDTTEVLRALLFINKGSDKKTPFSQ